MNVVLLNVQDPQHVSLLQTLINKAVSEAVGSLAKQQTENKSYSVTQTMKLMNLGRKKVNLLITEGILKVTSDNRITADSINNYYK